MIRPDTRQKGHSLGICVVGLAVALSLGGCLSGGQREKSSYQRLQEGIEDYKDSQDEFYEALEQDRKAYIVQRAGELGLSLDDPNVQKLMEPVNNPSLACLGARLKEGLFI